ncbi:hypothetical protein MTO96_048579 [Rhipicephalus appendiculatus]
MGVLASLRKPAAFIQLVENTQGRPGTFENCAGIVQKAATRSSLRRCGYDLGSSVFNCVAPSRSGKMESLVRRRTRRRSPMTLFRFGVPRRRRPDRRSENRVGVT